VVRVPLVVRGNAKSFEKAQLKIVRWYAKTLFDHLVVRGWEKVGNPWTRLNKSTKQIFWTPYRFANPNPKDLYGFILFIVCICTKDSSGFMRIFWIRENRLNLWKFRSRIKSTFWIFKDRTSKSRFANLWSQICQSQFKTNLFGVRICDNKKNSRIRKRNPCF